MTGITLVCSKVLHAVANFLLLACGLALTSSGMLVLFDAERILISTLLVGGPISELPQPVFHYVAIFVTVLGLTLTAIAILGCWASCMHSYWLSSIYFTLIMALLICECTVYAVMWMWPQCIGLGLDKKEVSAKIRERYATPGDDQLTAAVDLVQTSYNCCGYVTNPPSPGWIFMKFPLSNDTQRQVPLSCCVLKNRLEDRSYLNPKPVNIDLCMAVKEKDHQGYRHIISCEKPLQQWYREHYLAFLGIGLVVVLVEFFVLLSTVLTCTRIYHHNQKSKVNEHHLAQDLDGASSTFPKRMSSGHSYSNETYAMTDSFRQNYKLLDKV